MFRPNLDITPAGGHEAIFEGVGDCHGRLDPHDPCRALQRVGRPHHGFDRARREIEPLDREDARGKDGRLRVGLEAEQFKHRESAQILRHRMLLSIHSSRGSTPLDLFMQPIEEAALIEHADHEALPVE